MTRGHCRAGKVAIWWGWQPAVPRDTPKFPMSPRWRNSASTSTRAVGSAFLPPREHPQRSWRAWGKKRARRCAHLMMESMYADFEGPTAFATRVREDSAFFKALIFREGIGAD